MKFKYIMVPVDSDGVVGTNDSATALRYAENDDIIVIDAASGTVIQPQNSNGTDAVALDIPEQTLYTAI